jgi:anaerobic ribonucleoside-triphosphate reductase activating protein
VSLSINKAHWPVTALGYGRRIGLWLQGCSLRCPGCCSQDTWPADKGVQVAVADLIAWCRETADYAIDGVSISGGEPFEQPEGLLSLLQGLTAWRAESGREMDFLCYSGLPWKQLEQRHADILALLDAVIAEPHVHTLETAPLRGSSNQTVRTLTGLGERRYGTEALKDYAQPRFQMEVDGKRVWFIGIPQRGDLERLQERCRARGLMLNGISWRG